MKAPICKDCSGHGTRYYPGDPRRVTCFTCGGTGERAPKPIAREKAPNPLGDRKRYKMAQVVEHKMNYLAMTAEASGGQEYIDGIPAAPCQIYEDVIPINKADFSHKKAAGMGGAWDQGGQVQASNGTWSCRCCHAFIEQDIEAKSQHEASEATIENGLKVRFSPSVVERWIVWRKRSYNLPGQS